MGHNRTSFDGEIEAIKIALNQLICQHQRFSKVVLLSDSQSAIYAIANGEAPKTAEVQECRRLYTLLTGMNKTVVLQWIPGHCGIIGNEHADALAKKGTMILQTVQQEISFHTIKPVNKNKFKASRHNELQEKTNEKLWTQTISNIPEWPRSEAVAEFRLNTGHDCLAKHLHRIGVYPRPTYPLCQLEEEMDRDHLMRCPALKAATTSQRYWESRGQLMGQ